MLSEAHLDTFTTTVSHTTRQPRVPEKSKAEPTFFITPSKFSTLLTRKFFAEYTFFSGHFYGTSKQTIADQTSKGLAVVLDIDRHGAKQMKVDTSIDARYVFVKPPSFEEPEA